jgi:hypothetical protein
VEGNIYFLISIITAQGPSIKFVLTYYSYKWCSFSKFLPIKWTRSEFSILSKWESKIKTYSYLKFFFLDGAGDIIQGCEPARQVVYHWATSSALYSFDYQRESLHFIFFFVYIISL